MTKLLNMVLVVLSFSINTALAKTVIDKDNFSLEINGEIGIMVIFKLPYKSQYNLKATEGKNICLVNPTICKKTTWSASFSTPDIEQAKITFKPIYKIESGLNLYIEKNINLIPARLGSVPAFKFDIFDILPLDVTFGLGTKKYLATLQYPTTAAMILL